MSDRAFQFWQRWLVAAGVFFVAFGGVVAVWPDAPFLAMWSAAVADRFYGGAEPAQAAAFRRFVMGPLGGTIAGSYVLNTLVAAIPFARRERWALAGSLCVWFAVDSAVSVSHGAVFNVWMINAVPLLVFGVPLAATWPAFRAR
ncbi:hypothetical protein [Rubrivirga sp. IMCC43871]|uniref:hypothetical protein n=1 Tax=Rubrivirga sp. IMCC43871 TaxID=3391575 RepID=UPI00398F933F